MKVTEQIKDPIYEEMEHFEHKFSDSMSSKVALLNRITHFIVNRKGKQMRPMFVFLTAKLLGGGKVTERTYRGASVIELIHTATLVHDDVVCLILSLIYLQFFLLDELGDWLRGRDIRFTMLEFREHYFQMVILV